MYDREVEDEVEVVCGRVVWPIARRRFVSALQWIAWLCLTINTIVSVVDSLIDGSDPQDFVYDDEDDATLNGVDANLGFMPWWGYMIPQSIGFACATIAFIQEVRLYSGFSFIGLDLSWNAIDRYSKYRAIEQGQRSFSPIGAAYNNFYHISFLANLVTFAMYVFHVAFDRAPNRFAGFWLCIWVNFSVTLGYYIFKTYNARINQFEGSMVVDYRLVETEDTDRVLRQEKIAREAILYNESQTARDRRQPFPGREGVSTVVVDG